MAPPLPARLDPGKVQVRRDEVAFMSNLYRQDQVLYQDIQNENAKIQRQIDELDREYALIAKNIETQRAMLMQEKNRNSELKLALESKQQEVAYQRKQYDSVVEDRLKNHQQTSV
jgi:hypothetical protein